MHQRGAAWSGAVPPDALAPRLSTSWVVRKLVFISFAASFLQYWTHTTATQYVHLVLLLTAILFTEVVSYYSGDQYSVLYGMTLIAVVLSARLVLLQIGLPEVIRSFYHAGVVITLFLAVAGRSAITGYNAGARFSGNSDAHPNLVAFVLAGFLPVMIWRALEYTSPRKRRCMAALCALNFLLIFLSGSRGALLAVTAAATALAMRAGLAGRLKGKIRLRHVQVIVLLILVPLILAFLGRNGHYTKIEDFLNTALSLNNSQRGLKSGFSGRTVFWLKAIRRMHEEGRWLFGFGYRMGDVMVGTIDDGYLQLLFETGLISGLIILGALVTVFVRLFRMTQARENTVWLRYHTMLWCMLIVYFVNNVSTRYLFSFGNCFSICVLFLMAASRRELEGRKLAPTAVKAGRSWNAPPAAALEMRGIIR